MKLITAVAALVPVAGSVDVAESHCDKCAVDVENAKAQKPGGAEVEIRK
jgi:hypothetical protein